MQRAIIVCDWRREITCTHLRQFTFDDNNLLLLERGSTLDGRPWRPHIECLSLGLSFDACTNRAINHRRPRRLSASERERESKHGDTKCLACWTVTDCRDSFNLMHSSNAHIILTNGVVLFVRSTSRPMEKVHQQRQITEYWRRRQFALLCRNVYFGMPKYLC